MIEHQCRVKHDPENGTYGDCLRACIASILDEPLTENVPHFNHDGCEGEESIKRMRRFLKSHNLLPFFAGYPGETSLNELFDHMREDNPDVTYLLFGSSHENDHVVVCKNDQIVCNPAWYRSNPGLTGPNSKGTWVAMVIVRA